MSTRAPPSSSMTFGATALLCLSTVTSAFWIAISSAAPEFIWQGMRIALADFSYKDVLSGLLIGVVLAFFVEPIMHGLRSPRHHGPRSAHNAPAPRGAVFTAVLSLVFALASVSLHDAMTAFVSEKSGHHAPGEAGLAVALEIAISWAIVPLAIALAWLGARNTWARWPLAIAAAVSPFVTGMLFSWPPMSVATTAIPCLFILGLGYRTVATAQGKRGFTSAARMVVMVGAAWLATALVVDTLLGLFRVPARLYGPGEFWADARFYLGWVVGLMLAPFPLKG